MSLLIRGSVGPEVREMQNDLNRVGVTVDVDGIYGHTTEQAVRTFQASNGLTVDGAAGPNTQQKLAECIAALPEPAADPAADPPAEPAAEPAADPAADPPAEPAAS